MLIFIKCIRKAKITKITKNNNKDLISRQRHYSISKVGGCHAIKEDYIKDQYHEWIVDRLYHTVVVVIIYPDGPSTIGVFRSM